MKKRLRMALVLMLAVALCLTGCNPGGGGEKEGKDQAYQLTVCSMFTSADAMYEGLDYLCKLLEERTDGRIQCEFYGDKALTSSDEETADVISNGIADLSTIPSYTFANLDPTLNCFGMYEVPFLFLTEDEVYAFADSEYFRENCLNVAEEALGLKCYKGISLGWLMIGGTKDMSTLAAMKKCNIRTANTVSYVEGYGSFGGTITPLPWGEAYTAMQQGLVDGIVTCTPLWVSDGFYDIAKQVLTVNPNVNVHIPILRQEWYDQLPEDLAAIFDQCMDEYIEYTRKGYEKKSEEAIQFMKDFGIEVVYYTDETRQEWIDAGKTSWDRLAQEMGGRQVLDGIIQWLEDYRAQR